MVKWENEEMLKFQHFHFSHVFGGFFPQGMRLERVENGKILDR